MNIVTKEEVKKLMEIPCRGRGEHLLNAEGDALRLGGEEGVKKLKEEMERLGYPIDFKKIDPLDWYPIGLRVLTFIIFKKLFNLKDDDFIKIGSLAPAVSFISRFFFKYFRFQAVAFEHTPDYWKKNYSCGRLEAGVFREEKGPKRSFTIKLHDFKIHPIYCKYFLGYFVQICQLLGGKKVTIKETKCMFKGDPYHEFLIRWTWEPKWEVQEPVWKGKPK